MPMLWSLLRLSACFCRQFKGLVLTLKAVKVSEPSYISNHSSIYELPSTWHKANHKARMSCMRSKVKAFSMDGVQLSLTLGVESGPKCHLPLC